MNHLKFAIAILSLLVILSGCASVPTASVEQDQARKEFSEPQEGMAGLYIYRNSRFGAALKKSVAVDGVPLGQTAPMTYFYALLEPGKRTVSTESEFGDNTLHIEAQPGENYFVRQYMKMGVFIGGSNLELVNEEEGRKGVLECTLAADPYNR